MSNSNENDRFIWTRVFEVSGLRYKFFVTEDYEVMFSLIYGILPDGRRFPEYDPFEQWENENPGTTLPVYGVENPVKVFRFSIEMLKEFLTDFKPSFFKFTYQEKDYYSLYLKLSYKIAKKSGYDFLPSSSRWFEFYNPSYKQTN